MPFPFRAPFLSYEKINELTEGFLEEHGIGSRLPRKLLGLILFCPFLEKAGKPFLPVGISVIKESNQPN